MVNKRKGAESKKPKAESKPGKIRKNKPTKTNKERLLTALCLTKRVNNSRSPSLHNEKEKSACIPSSSPEQARAIAETTFEESFIITDVSGIKHLSLNHSVATSSPKTVCRRRVDDLFRFDISPIVAQSPLVLSSPSLQLKVSKKSKKSMVVRKKRKRITMKRPVTKKKKNVSINSSRIQSRNQSSLKTGKSVTNNLKKWAEKKNKLKTSRELPSYALNRLSICSFSMPKDGTLFPTPEKSEQKESSIQTTTITKNNQSHRKKKHSPSFKKSGQCFKQARKAGPSIINRNKIPLDILSINPKI